MFLKIKGTNPTIDVRIHVLVISNTGKKKERKSHFCTQLYHHARNGHLFLASYMCTKLEAYVQLKSKNVSGSVVTPNKKIIFDVFTSMYM